MGGIGCSLALLASFFLAIGMVPLFGWLNWITTLPLALLATVFSYLSLRDQPGNSLARWGLIAGVLIFALGAFRLSLGAGIF